MPYLSVNAFVLFYIEEAPMFLSRSDSVQTGPTRIIQPEGTTVQLKCLASGKPTPEVRWKKNGKVLSEDEYGVTQSVIQIGNCLNFH